MWDNKSCHMFLVFQYTSVKMTKTLLTKMHYFQFILQANFTQPGCGILVLAYRILKIRTYQALLSNYYTLCNCHTRLSDSSFVFQHNDARLHTVMPLIVVRGGNGKNSTDWPKCLIGEERVQRKGQEYPKIFSPN